MRFVEALEQGLISEFGTPDRKIVTMVSTLFIYGERVLKVYNHERYFFADLHTFRARKQFYIDDFFWNATAAPDIYLHLWGIQEKSGTFMLVPVEAGDDFVIEMKRIDATCSLTQLLLENKLTKEQAASFIHTLVDTLATLTKKRTDELSELFTRGLFWIMQHDLKSLHDWMLAVPEIPKQESDAIYHLLTQQLAADPYFVDPSTHTLMAALDNNCDNLLLLDGRASFIDIMPPMFIWRAVDEYATISRTVVDIEVLGGTTLGTAAREAYASYQRDIPMIAQAVHELRAACIQWAYRHITDQHETAERFAVVARERYQTLADLVPHSPDT